MPERDPQTNLTPARLALLRVYCAIDDETPRNDDRTVPDDVRERMGAGIRLAEALRNVVGIDVRPFGTPTAMLEQLAEAVAEERREVAETDETAAVETEETADRPSDEPAPPAADVPPDEEPPPPPPPLLPLVRLAEAALDVSAVAGGRDRDDFNRVADRVAELLVVPDSGVPGDPSRRVSAALRLGEVLDDGRSRRDTWSEIQGPAGGADLQPELRGVRDSRCDDDLVAYRDEFVARIDTEFVIDRGVHDMDTLAAATMPEHWSDCNDFFCSVHYAPDRSKTTPGSSPEALTARSTTWRGVYEEKVMTCPDGAFPNTFLQFDWNRNGNDELVLIYRLAPGLEGACDLEIDQGHITVTFVDGEIIVRTRKWLLFDDRRRRAGGQTLGLYACRLGWVDYSIAQFSGCAQKLPKPFGKPGQADPIDPLPAAQARLDDLVNRAERELRTCGHQIAADLDACCHDLRHGEMRTDDHIGRVAAAVTAHAARGGAGWLEGQVDFSLAWVDLLRALAANWRDAHV